MAEFKNEREVPVRAVTFGPKHHFFGYYDKFPWDATGRYMLALETTFINRPPDSADKAVIGLIELEENEHLESIQYFPQSRVELATGDDAPVDAIRARQGNHL